MGRFVSPLCVELICESPPLWRLTGPLLYRSGAHILENCHPDRMRRELARDLIVVPTGFETDFSSVPRAPLVWWWLGDRAKRAGALHDWLYTIQCCEREQADAVYLEAMAATGLDRLERWLMYRGVRAGGASHWTAITAKERTAAIALLAAWIEDIRKGPVAA